MRSLQKTLALRYAGTMLAALLFIGTWAYLGVRAALERELDQRLERTAALAVDVIAGGEALSVHSELSGSPQSERDARRLIVIRDSAGRVLEVATGGASALPLDRAALTLARAGERGWATSSWAGNSYRSLYVPGPPRPGNQPFLTVIEVAESLGPLSRAGHAVLWRMLATALLGTLLTGAGAAWLARSSLAPVAEIAKQAREIRSSGGPTRITAHADVVELQDLIAVLNGMLTRLDAALGEQRRITRDVGHELRTPITAMRGEIEVALRRERRPEEYRALLGSVLEEVDRLALIGDQLITLTRFQTGDLTLDRRRVQLGNLLEDAVSSAERRLAGHPVRIELPAVGIECELDAHLVSMALAQLLDNVVRHTPAGASIVLGLRQEAGGVVVSVDDSGPGVAGELLTELFAPFFKPDPARTRGAGVGLGLAVVAAVARLHDGSAAAARSPLGGLRIELSFPQKIAAIVA